MQAIVVWPYVTDDGLRESQLLHKAFQFQTVSVNDSAITIHAVALHAVCLSLRDEMSRWIRHPLRMLRALHATLIDRTITANLDRAREHARNDNQEGFVRHIGHAACLARRHAPERVADVERVAQTTVDLLGDSTERASAGSHGFESDA